MYSKVKLKTVVEIMQNFLKKINRPLVVGVPYTDSNIIDCLYIYNNYVDIFTFMVDIISNEFLLVSMFNL